MQQSKRAPNIVLIMADQLAPQFTGAYGHPLVKTPHIDALAARGMRYDAAYCNSPLCAPSRFSFMSGQLISRIAAYDNASEFPASIPTFAHYLRLMGYRTCLSGKMHFVGPDQLHGFEERLTTDVYPADFGWVPNWHGPDERIDLWYHNMLAVKQAGVAAMVAGAPTTEVDRAARSVITDAGWGDAFTHGTGHGVGIDIHELPRVSSTSTETYAVGTVATVEPGVYLRGVGGVRVEDTCVVTASGAERLTGYPKDPEV